MADEDLVVDPPLNVRSYLRPARRGVISTGVLSILAAQMEAVALVLLVPIAQALAEDQEALRHDLGPVSVDVSLTAASLLSLTLIVFTFLLTLAVAKVRANLMGRWEQQERDRLLSSYMRADWSVQAGIKAGHVQGLSGYASRGGQLLGAVVNGLRGLVSVVMFVALSFVVDWRSAVLVTVVGLCLFGVLRPLSRRIRQQNRRMAQQTLLYGNAVAETTSMAREVRVFGAWGPFEDRLLTRSDELGELRRRTQFLSQTLGPTYQYGGMLVLVGALLFAAGQDTIEVTQLGAVAVLMLRSLNYANQLQAAWQVVLDSTPFLEKLQAAEGEFMSVPPESGGVTIGPVSTLDLRDISYSYGGSEDGSDGGSRPEVALDGISLTLRAGEVVGVVGPSGAGKSTLAQVLLRLRRPDTGAMFADDVSASGVDLASWYQQVTFVPQSNVLFHGTVAENIGFLVPGATPERIEDAARRAHVHDVIMALPDGYQTQIGATTRDLSGGQIQRIGIARAFARKPSVVVLDEPTSALDVHSESAIHDALREARADMMMVVIAHRLSTLSICDRIVVMEQGRITADGPLSDVALSSQYFRSALDLGTFEPRSVAPH